MANANIKAVITAEDKSAGALQGFSNNVDKVGSQISASMKVAAVAFAAATTAAATFAFKSAADFEQTRIGLENMLGSAETAKQVLSDVSKFAAETPFEFPELAGSVKQLVAFGFSGEEAIKTMKQLGDVSAAVGAPIGDLSYLMGTLKTQGRAFTIDLRQFAQRGIPIYEYLGKVLKVSTEELSGLVEEGKIGFPEVAKAFEMMTAEGGKFNNTMAKQSKSLNGLFSTLKDTLGQTARELVGINSAGDITQGSPLDKLKNGVTGLTASLQANMPRIQEFMGSLIVIVEKAMKYFIEFGKATAEYLEPKLTKLSETIQAAMPTLTQLWQEIIEPLAVALGQTLVFALGLTIDAVTKLIEILTPIIQFMLDNKPVVLGLAAAFTTLGVAMNFTAISSAFSGAMAGVMGSIGATRVAVSGLYATLLAHPFAIIAAAAIVAFTTIMNEGRKLQAELAAVQDAVRDFGESKGEYVSSLGRALREGRIDRATYDKRLAAYNQSISQGHMPGRAIGGSVMANKPYKVGENGEEIFVPQTSGRIIPNDQVNKTDNSTININIQAGAYMGSKQDAREYAKMMLDAMKEIAASKSMTVNQMIGA